MDFAILYLNERLNKIYKNYFCFYFVIEVDSFYIDSDKNEFR